MIFDNIKNAKQYFKLSPNVRAGLEFLMQGNLSDLKCGKYTIVEDKVFAIVQEYQTKENIVFEAHKKFIDIQYIAKGAERLGFCDVSNCKLSSGYDKSKDIEFFNSFQHANFINLIEGNFMIFYPNDAHAPSLSIKEPEAVKKIVVKVAVG